MYSGASQRWNSLSEEQAECFFGDHDLLSSPPCVAGPRSDYVVGGALSPATRWPAHPSVMGVYPLDTRRRQEAPAVFMVASGLPLSHIATRGIPVDYQQTRVRSHAHSRSHSLGHVSTSTQPQTHRHLHGHSRSHSHGHSHGGHVLLHSRAQVPGYHLMDLSSARPMTHESRGHSQQYMDDGMVMLPTATGDVKAVPVLTEAGSRPLIVGPPIVDPRLSDATLASPWTRERDASSLPSPSFRPHLDLSEATSTLVTTKRTPEARAPMTTTASTRSSSKCPHSVNSCLVFAGCCRLWFGCIVCHDFLALHNDNPHFLLPSTVSKMYCLKCGFVQNCSQYCVKCQQIAESSIQSLTTGQKSQRSRVSEYYCPLCKIWDSNTPPKYHCSGCERCRLVADASGSGAKKSKTKLDGDLFKAERIVTKKDTMTSARQSGWCTPPKSTSGSSRGPFDKSSLVYLKLKRADLPQCDSDTDNEEEEEVEDECCSKHSESETIFDDSLICNVGFEESARGSRGVYEEDADTEADLNAITPMSSWDRSSPALNLLSPASDRLLTPTKKDASGRAVAGFFDLVPPDKGCPADGSSTGTRTPSDFRPMLKMASTSSNGTPQDLSTILKIINEVPAAATETTAVSSESVKAKGRSGVCEEVEDVKLDTTTTVESSKIVLEEESGEERLCGLCEKYSEASLRLSSMSMRISKTPRVVKCEICSKDLGILGTYKCEVLWPCLKHGVHLDCLKPDVSMSEACPLCSFEKPMSPLPLISRTSAGAEFLRRPLLQTSLSREERFEREELLTPSMTSTTAAESRRRLLGRHTRMCDLDYTPSSKDMTPSSAYTRLSSYFPSTADDLSPSTSFSVSASRRKSRSSKRKRTPKRYQIVSPMNMATRWYGNVSFVIGERLMRLIKQPRFESIPWNSLLGTALQGKCCAVEGRRKLFRRHGFKFFFSQAMDEWVDVSIVPKQLEKFKSRGEKQRKKRQQEKAKHFIEKRIQKRKEKQRKQQSAASGSH